MIDSGYSYSKVGVKKIERDCHLNEHIYKFKSNKSGAVYHVQVDEYCHEIYFVKFYKGLHKTHPNKFGYILNTHDAYKVIRTSIDVLLEILAKNPSASFGFLGSPSTNKKGEKEGPVNTQRFRIYEYITKNYFGHLSFTHSYERDYSCYLLVNNCNANREDYIQKVSTVFKTLYPSLLEIHGN